MKIGVKAIVLAASTAAICAVIALFTHEYVGVNAFKNVRAAFMAATGVLFGITYIPMHYTELRIRKNSGTSRVKELDALPWHALSGLEKVYLTLVYSGCVFVGLNGGGIVASLIINRF